MAETLTGLTLLVRTGAEPIASAVLNGRAGRLPDTMEQIISQSLAERRLTMLLLTIFAGTARLPAAVGIYGVMCAVNRRTHETGIRTTLGASHGEIVGLVLPQDLRLIAAGLIAGLAAGFLTLRVLAKLLYGVRPGDPLTLAAVSCCWVDLPHIELVRRLTSLLRAVVIWTVLFPV